MSHIVRIGNVRHLLTERIERVCAGLLVLAANDGGEDLLADTHTQNEARKLPNSVCAAAGRLVSRSGRTGMGRVTKTVLASRTVGSVPHMKSQKSHHCPYDCWINGLALDLATWHPVSHAPVSLATLRAVTALSGRFGTEKHAISPRKA